jgi:hypothetical protein
MMVTYLSDGSIRTVRYLENGKCHVTIEYNGFEEVSYIS